MNTIKSNNHELPELIPIELLFNTPIKSSHAIKIPQLSPDGKKVIYFSSINDILGLCIKVIGEEYERLLVTDEKMSIVDYKWITDEYIIYFQDIKKTQNTVMYSLHIETGDIKQLTPEKNVHARYISHNEYLFPGEVIISMNKDNPSFMDLYHVNILTETITLIYRDPGNIVGWLVNNNLKLQGMVLLNNDGTTDVIIRENEQSQWKTLLTWDVEDKPLSQVIYFSKDNRYIYLTDTRKSNTCRMVKMEIATGNTEVIAEDYEYDIINKMNDLLIDPVTLEIQAVSITKYRKEWIILDETIIKDFEVIKKLDNGDFSILDTDKFNETLLIRFDRDDSIVSYYVFNRKSKKGLLLFNGKSPLKDYTMASMEEVTFTSRDGLTIHGYITYPPGLDRNNLPLVIYVHEGPWLRDVWGYNPVVQFFANRGYVCLQVNYRGSTGYGKDFFKAGYKEWGGKMQDDLTDAVNWAVKEKIADPHRIAVYGFAYGGYAALIGATTTPELFRCAVAINCPSNLITLIQSLPSYMKNHNNRFVKRIGDPDTEREFLISRSPYYKAKKVKIPVLISHGFNNQIIKSSESYEMVKAIRSMGIESEYVVLQKEGRNISAKSFIKLHTRIDKFLAKHLGGRYEREKIFPGDISIANSTDKKFVEEILRQGDPYAFEKLEKRYKKPLMKHIFSMTGDYHLSIELSQETFLNLWLYLDTYNFNMSFSTWIFSIATNAVKRYYMMNYNPENKIDINELDNYMIIQGWEKDIEDKVLFQSRINYLKEPYRTAVNLRFMENMDYKTIASIMNTSETQIKNYLFRAKNLLINSRYSVLNNVP